MRILLLFEHSSVQQRHCLFAAKYSINAGKYSYDIFVHSSLCHWLFVARYLSTALSLAQAHHDAEGSNEGTLYSRRSASLVAVFLLYLGFCLQSYHSVWRIWSFLLQSVTEKRKFFWGKKRVEQCSCRKKKGKYKRNTIEILKKYKRKQIWDKRELYNAPAGSHELLLKTETPSWTN